MPPTTYNYSLGIESKLPYSLLMNVSYVGSVSNHLLDTMNFNPVPFGAAFSVSVPGPDSKEFSARLQRLCCPSS